MKKFALVGAGHRGVDSYIIPLTKNYGDDIRFVGLYDKNILRTNAAESLAAYKIPVFFSWDEMIETANPDVVIVTTVDSAHDEYIVKALNSGCDVISEKPLTTDQYKLKAICDAEKKTGKKVTVTFNCRFMPPFMRLKEVVDSGVIGDILSVNYQWLLDTVHGALYFRRWHSESAHSGSLLIHKSTHHFDILNWLLNDEPEKVSAFGTRRFYGAGIGKKDGGNCRECDHKTDCEFYYDINSNPYGKKLYLDCKEVDGYVPDRCIYSDKVDIPDSATLNIKYKGGVIATYSLTTYSPYEGVHLILNGTKGRLEFNSLFGNKSFAGISNADIKIYNRLSELITISIPDRPISETVFENGELMKSLNYDAGHGGSDSMLRYALVHGLKNDSMNLLAGLKAGALSAGIGIAANISMKENRIVSLSEFIPEIQN